MGWFNKNVIEVSKVEGRRWELYKVKSKSKGKSNMNLFMEKEAMR